MRLDTLGFLTLAHTHTRCTAQRKSTQPRYRLEHGDLREVKSLGNHAAGEAAAGPPSNSATTRIILNITVLVTTTNR